MHGKTSKEDGEHENPLDVLKERLEQSLFVGSVTHDGERDVAETSEHNDDREPHLPGVEVVLVEVTVVPTHGEVVDCSHDPGSADSIVSSDV